MQQFYCRNCAAFIREHLLEVTHHYNPFATGDHTYCELEQRCPDCRSDELEPMEPCEACASEVPLEGLDDCALCILRDQYSHTTNYDAGDHQAASEWLQANRPGDLSMLEEIADRRRMDYLESRAEVKR